MSCLLTVHIFALAVKESLCISIPNLLRKGERKKGEGKGVDRVEGKKMGEGWGADKNNIGKQLMVARSSK